MANKYFGSLGGNTSSPWLIMCVAHNRRTAVRLSPAVRTLCHVFDSRGHHKIFIYHFAANKYFGSLGGNTSSPWLIMCVAHNRRTAVRLSPAVRTLCHVFDSRGHHKIFIYHFAANKYFGSPNGNRTRVTGMRIRCPNR